jgi:hypothetical protein
VILAALALAGLLAAGSAKAETPTEEFVSLARCAAALGLYEGYLEDNENREAQRLTRRVQAVEDRLEGRLESLAAGMSEETITGLAGTVMDEVTARVTSLVEAQADSIEILAAYSETLEACALRGEALPAA